MNQTPLLEKSQSSADPGQTIHSKIQHFLQAAHEAYQKSHNLDATQKECQSWQLKAVELAKSALELDQYNPEIYNLLGRIELDRNRLEQAAQYIEQARKLDPKSAGYTYSQGHIFLANGDYGRAEQAFLNAIALDDTATKARQSLAYVNSLQGKYVDAFHQYRALIKGGDSSESVVNHLFECIKQLDTDHYNETLAEDVISYYEFDNVDHQQLARLSASLLIAKYRLDDPNSTIELLQLCHDTLLISSLKKVTFISEAMENFITKLRRVVLIESLSQSNIDHSVVQLAIAIGLYCATNEYVLANDTQELQLLTELENLLVDITSSKQWRCRDIEGALVMTSMYRSVNELKCSPLLRSKELNQWSFAAQALIRRTLIEPDEELQLARAFKPQTIMTNDTSLKVRHQYELNPYPRWKSIGFHTPTNYQSALANELRGFKHQRLFDKERLKILIAGCGTGRHALSVATYFRDVDVYALDISQRSLAYAQRKAEQYNIDNIQFWHADLLHLPDLGQQFDIIECSGVLHHMAAPQQGWQSLYDSLANDGLLKVGLYSRLARKNVSQLRDLIAQQKLDSRPETIRAFRYQLMHSDNKSHFSDILQSQDFYSLSGCRDLLFHQQELQFDPLQIKTQCQQLNLDFLGFVKLPTHTQQNYQRLFPNDRKMTNLENWHAFEICYPSTFSSMYQFYCQKRSHSAKLRPVQNLSHDY